MKRPRKLVLAELPPAKRIKLDQDQGGMLLNHMMLHVTARHIKIVLREDKFVPPDLRGAADILHTVGSICLPKTHFSLF